jgi:hypothetical protein
MDDAWPEQFPQKTSAGLACLAVELAFCGCYSGYFLPRQAKDEPGFETGGNEILPNEINI